MLEKEKERYRNEVREEVKKVIKTLESQKGIINEFTEKMKQEEYSQFLELIFSNNKNWSRMNIVMNDIKEKLEIIGKVDYSRIIDEFYRILDKYQT